MPTDPKGRELIVGDKVIVPFQIIAIHGDKLALAPEIALEKGPDVVHLEASQVYRLRPGDEVYTGGSDPDADGDIDAPGKPADPGGD